MVSTRLNEKSSVAVAHAKTADGAVVVLDAEEPPTMLAAASVDVISGLQSKALA